jgi:hypothetical protein
MLPFQLPKTFSVAMREPLMRKQRPFRARHHRPVIKLRQRQKQRRQCGE